ncbi:MAG: S8 family serine peptidase [Magnetococcales bacterium]|nr:S8 family serine peptidase [Magnetococcales bacterium]
MRHHTSLEAATSAFVGAAMDGVRGLLPSVAGLEWDNGFTPVALAGRSVSDRAESVFNAAMAVRTSDDPADGTYLLRGTLADPAAADKLRGHEGVVGVFSDPEIAPCITCGGSSPLGTAADVEALLCTSRMQTRGCAMDGRGVLMAIVDTGINLKYLQSTGKNPTIDSGHSWTPDPSLIPFELPVGHGTMCAFDALIAAPRCTLLDIAVLQSTKTGPTVMSGVLSDAVLAYNHLIKLLQNAPRGRPFSLVVSNSWGMFHPSWDFPKGDPGNYSHNPNHPFNRIVGDLERAGADILFAAGNCGPECPDGRCQGVTTKTITGANSHPAVLTVAGVDITKTRVGYSSVGPGALTRYKPDISGYTHFSGSGVWPADSGTSAATPVVAGVIAAVRSKRPFSPTNPTSSPAAIRALVTSNAQDLGSQGYDYAYGYGVIDSCRLVTHFRCRKQVLNPVCEECRRRCADLGSAPIPNPYCRRCQKLCPDQGNTAARSDVDHQDPEQAEPGAAGSPGHGDSAIPGLTAEEIAYLRGMIGGLRMR